MNALSLLNTFEKEFGRPFFRAAREDRNWLNDFAESDTQKVLPASMKYDEEKATWNLVVELAGVTKENVKIDTTDGYLRLIGEKTKGFNTGKFEGLYNLPEGIDEEKIEATFEDGILNVCIPTTEKKSTAKSIQIK